jgi:hypothetical protein
MKEIKRGAGILTITVLLACGGTGMRVTGRNGGEVGVGVPIGGAAGIADTDGTAGNISGIASQGGTTSKGGSSGSTLNPPTIDAGIAICGCGSSSNSSCDRSMLWNALNSAAVLTGYGHDCAEIPAPDPTPNPSTVSSVNVRVDSNGKVIDSSIPFNTVSEKQAWLDSLADYRWPCLAGQTLFFYCPWGYF